MIDYIKMIEQEQIRTDLPNIAIGDYVRVHLKVREGTRERIQVFEGTIIARKSGGLNETITVRRLSYGVGVERVLPLHSPRISRIEIVRRGKIRRAKLYYLRDRVGKAARVKERLELRDSKKTSAAAPDTSAISESAIAEAENVAAIEQDNAAEAVQEAPAEEPLEIAAEELQEISASESQETAADDTAEISAEDESGITAEDEPGITAEDEPEASAEAAPDDSGEETR